MQRTRMVQLILNILSKWKKYVVIVRRSATETA